jgi:photosystem II stability/assembly factor-like uncharacterized protein
MKRAALSITLLVTLLSLLPFTANAQKGWVRMPDGPWEQPARIHFFDELNGIVEDVTSDALGRFGRLLRVTSDGGITWWTDSTLWRNSTGYCQYPYSDRKWKSRFSIRSSGYGESIAVFGGEEDVSNCEQRAEYKSRIWAYDMVSKRWGSDSLPSPDAPTPEGGAAVITLEIRGDVIHGLPFYANTGIGSMFRSTDAGKSWISFPVPSRDSGIDYIESVFQNSDTGFVKSFATDQIGSFGILMRTVDGCKTWTMILSRRDDPKAISKPDTRYGNNGLWYSSWESPYTVISSSDVGLTWQPAVEPPHVDSSVYPDANYDYLSGYRVVAGGAATKIEFTSNKGQAWSEQTEIPIVLQRIAAPSMTVAYAVGNNGLLYKTTDGGGRFADVATTEEKPTKLKAWTNGDVIIVENFSDEIQVFDLLGRLLRTSRGEKLDGFAAGMYFVVSGGESVRVLVTP